MIPNNLYTYTTMKTKQQLTAEPSQEMLDLDKTVAKKIVIAVSKFSAINMAGLFIATIAAKSVEKVMEESSKAIINAIAPGVGAVVGGLIALTGSGIALSVGISDVRKIVAVLEAMDQLEEAQVVAEEPAMELA